MNKYMIRGGRELFGEVTVSGAKNAAVAIIPAALLVDGVCRIENIPQISDVTLFFSILEELGAKVRVLNQHAIEIDCHAIHSTRPSYDLARRIRASYYLLGALLGRFGQATVAMPGGCNFGVRPIDQHIKGFEAMGAMVEQSGGYVCADAPKGGLRGGHVYLDIVSVGADIAAGLLDHGAHGLEALDVLVDGADAEVAAARHGDMGMAEAAKLCADEIIRRADTADKLDGRGRVAGAGAVDLERVAAVAPDLRAHIAQDLQQQTNV